MDFLDPQKQRRHDRLLLIGYVFIGIAILLVATLLLYEAYGFGITKNGTIIQKGFVFVSSLPSGSNIHLDNNQPTTAKTNTRLSVPSGQYTLQITRNGYQPWQTTLFVLGGSVQHYDYPFLIPLKLTSTPVKNYDSAPTMTTQSPDKRWFLVELAGDPPVFEIHDLKNSKLAPTTVSLPANKVSVGATQSWQAVEWSADNQHVLLQHTYDDKTEFIVVDSTDVSKSVNLNKTLGVNPTKITLLNKKYDQYYLYTAANQTISTATLNNPQPTAVLDHVLAYHSYGNDLLLYASSQAVTSGKVAINLWQNGKTSLLREVSPSPTYLLDFTKYSGSWFMALGSVSEGRVYIYKDPQAQLQSKTGQAVPIFVLKTPNPQYLSFSDNARFIVDENGSQFAVYDNENLQGFTYDTKRVLDAPQQHASWMDGHHLTYVSGGKLLMLDFDGANAQDLVPANPAYVPAFDPSFKFVDVLAPGANNQLTLTTTQLRTPADQ